METKSDNKARRILIVDNNREQVESTAKALSEEGHTTSHCADTEGTLHRLKAWKPHLVLLSLDVLKISGMELIRKIRSLTEAEYASILVVAPESEWAGVSEALAAGADDYILRPYRAVEFGYRIRSAIRLKDLHDSLRRANHRIEDLALTDDLTGLLNMRALNRRGEEEILRSRRFKKPLSALVVNIDHFATVNETADFHFGSQVLCALGAKIKKCVRSVDLVARVGADEFFVLLLETDLSGAEFVAERIRDAIEGSEIKSEKHVAKVTACIGVAGFMTDRTEGEMKDLIHHANEALRAAKSSGPNHIDVYSFA